ncbi:MAG: endonuclease [Rhizobacter sp.]|nr:endonuclease [Rhizobacter sp.]
MQNPVPDAPRQTRRPLLLAHLTLLHVPPPEFVSIAAQVGYDGVSLHISQPASGVRYPMLGEDSAMLREVLARLADTGIAVHDIQGVRLYPDTRVADFLPMFEAGARLGARYAVTLSDDPDANRNADRIGEIAALAAPFGIDLVLEFMVYSGIKTLQDANRLLDQSGAANAQVMVDSLHWHRSGGTLLDIAETPAARMPYLQICDAPLATPEGGFEGLRFEALKQRQFVGEGELPLREFLRAYPGDIAVSVETPVTLWHDRMSNLQIAERSIQTTRHFLDALAAMATNDSSHSSRSST